MNTTEFDEVYIASLKEIFKELDDEIIWTALFEYGYKTGEYKAENVINYLLEITNTEDNSKSSKLDDNSISPKLDDDINNYDNKNRQRFIIPDNNYNYNDDNDNNQQLLNNSRKNIDEDEEPSLLDTIISSINFNNGYEKINDS